MAQVPMPLAVDRSPIGHLAAELAIGATTLTLQSGDFAGCLIYSTGRLTIGSRSEAPETLGYTQSSGETLTLSSPTTQAWPAGTEVSRVLAAADLNGLIANVQDHESRFVAKPTAAGQIPIGHADGTITQATITAGANITVTNADGSISIAAAGSSPTGIIKVRGYNGSSAVIPAFSAVHCNSYHGDNPAALCFTLADSTSLTGCEGIVGINLVALEVPTGDPALWDELFTQDVVIQGVVENPAWNIAPAGEVKYFGVGEIRSGGFQYWRSIGYGLTTTSLYVFQSASEDPLPLNLNTGMPLLNSETWVEKGDLLVATGANSASRFPVGTGGQVLMASSYAPTGLIWGSLDAVEDYAIDSLSAPGDNTALNATTAAHGLCPKGDGSTSHYLRGDLTWAAPVAGAPTLLPGQCSTSIAVGSVVHAQPQVLGTFLNWEQAEPTSVSQFTIVGIVQANGTSASVAVSGIIPIPETAICPGYPVWLGPAGTLSETSTGDVPKFLGWVVDSTHLYWYPQI